MKQALKFAVLFIFLTGMSHASPENIIGKYMAVTESELVIELCLFPDKTAHLLSGYYPVEDEDEDTRSTIVGAWTVKDDILTLDFEQHNTYTYRITNKLSYAEFGYSGTSFGLKPIKATQSNRITFYELWRPEVLSSIFDSKVSSDCTK